ncbi:MFS transporter [Roseibium alexandrii]|uniref:Arabinose efflux permease n=1 Tax=Roseibium alexandrii (strain DSM 17067 / NCIMB 14079 / DFL-11) TaxID=244592 RepID=A0A5E8H3G7_ROSAD|nr:MFS transporter [Roseibium alexandrii]EEE45861.1 Arabinose efflux permease [Roseibium alexandrii DFL-11]
MPTAIYILALAAFVVGTQSYVFSGLLADLARDLGVTVSSAGQLVAVFAIASALASPLVVSALSRFERKKVLIASLAGVSAINLVTAFLPVFEGFLAARVLVAIVSAGVMPMAGSIGASLVPAERQGQALGMILSGLTIAFIVGVPFGTVIGSAFGWRATFVFAAVVALAVIPAIAFLVPSSAADKAPPKSDWSVVKKPIVLLALFLISSSFIAAYPIIAYLGPIITASTSLEGAGIGAMQSAIGFGSIGGLVVGSRLADRRAFLPNMRIMYLVFAVVLGVWSVVFLTGTSNSWFTIAVVALVILLTSATLIAPSPAIEKALVQADPRQSALTLALNTSVIYLGQGIGAGIGGLVVGSVGFAALGYFGAGIALVAVTTAAVVKIDQRGSDHAD